MNLYNFITSCPRKSYLKLKHYKNDDWRLYYGTCKEKGWEASCENKENNKKSISSSCEAERCSLSRAKSEIIDIARSNDWSYFTTMTVSSSSCDRFSLEHCQELLHKSLKEYQRRCRRFNLNFKYLVVTEKHEKGGFHFHALFSCFLPDDIITNKNDYPTSKFFSERMGHFSFSKIKNPLRCAYYISKYITECPIKNNTNQLYFCSKGLARAEVFDLQHGLEDLTILRNFWGFENDYVKIKDFSFEKIPKEIQLFLFSKKDF